MSSIKTTAIRPALPLLALTLGLACIAPPHGDAPEPPASIGKTKQALESAVAAPTSTWTYGDVEAVALTATNVERFLWYAAGASSAQTAGLISAIYAARCAPPPASCPVLDALLARMNTPPNGDLVLQLTTLRVIGEFGDARAKDALVTYVNRPVRPAQRYYDGDPMLAPRGQDLILASTAVEALAFLGTSDALNATLTIATSHPERPVRVSAIQAYVHNSSDEAAARATIRAALPTNEKIHADRFFKVAGMTPSEYSQKVAAFRAVWPASTPSTSTKNAVRGTIPQVENDPAPVIGTCPPNTACY